MRPDTVDRMAAMVFVFFAALYSYVLFWVGHSETQNTFDLIQGVHVFDIDDVYRLFLVKGPLESHGLWLWNYMLPGAVAFDGVALWLTNDNVVLVRAIHMLCVLGSLFLVYRSGRKFGIHPAWMLASCVLLLSMPLYALLSMSFYGECLLAAMMGVVVYAIAHEKERLLVFMASLLPLVRPEGLFFLIAIVALKVFRRQFRSAICLLIPGFLYFCVVMYYFDFSLDAYFSWRNALSSQYAYIPADEQVMGFGWMPYYTINPFWWLIALMGGAVSALHPLRVLVCSVIILMVYWGIHCFIIEDARGEARYYYAAFPVLAVSFAAMGARLQAVVTNRWSNKAVGWFLPLLVVFIAIENFAQIDQVKFAYFGDRRWPVAGLPAAERNYYAEAPDVREWRNTTARFLEAYSNYDPSIRRVIIHAYPVFKDLDAHALPPHVRVEYSPMTPVASRNYFFNYFYSMFPDFPQYTFYKFFPEKEASQAGNAEYALYVGPLYNGVHSPVYANPVFQVYKVKFSEHLHPRQSP